MDFATLPPEISSAQMYSGPGPRSMISASAAWDRLAAQLHTRAADYRSVTSGLARRCDRPVATRITRDATPLASWLRTAATHAEQTAVHARAAASAYESALAAMVPPTVIHANRTRRRSLVSTNYLGHNAAAIADIDAEYDQMWARNADAMYTYADASADASALTPFSSPPGDPGAAEVSWALSAAPDVIATGRHVMAAIPEALQGLSSSPLARFESSFAPVTPSLSKLNSLTAATDCAISHLNSMNKAAALRSLLPTAVAVADVASVAGIGRGGSVGALRVPEICTMAAAQPVRVTPRWFGEPVRLVAVSERADSAAASEYRV